MYPSLNCDSGRWVGGRGERSDLSTVCDAVREGASLRDVAQEHPATFVRNYKGLAVLRSLLNPLEGTWRGPKCIWFLHGDTGTGKTRLAFERHPHLYRPLCAGKGVVWWDGYCGEETILFDDIRDGDIAIRDLLTWCDGRDFRAPVKGGTVEVRCHTIIFTSNDSIAQCWPGRDVAPFMRRVTFLAEFRQNKPIKVVRGAVDCCHGHEVGPVILSPVQPPAAARPMSPDLLEVLEDNRVVTPDPQWVLGSNPDGFPVVWT